eukprot:scaffold1783_cov71-Attheya_sp.AAC.3
MSVCANFSSEGNSTKKVRGNTVYQMKMVHEFSTRLLRAPHTGHTGHTGTHPHHAHIVCHNKEGRHEEALATCDEEARREGLATCGWVLSLMILSPVRQWWAYQPPSLTYTFVGKKYNQFGNTK